MQSKTNLLRFGVLLILAFPPPTRAAEDRGSPLVDVPMPAAKHLAAPAVSVEDMGTGSASMGAPLYRAFRDGSGRARFLQTADGFLIMDEHGQVAKRIKALSA